MRMTCAGARCCAALPVPALEAHGGSAGAPGHHIDLALTDTCRGGRGRCEEEGRREVTETLVSVIKSSPARPVGQTANICYNAPPLHHLPTPISSPQSPLNPPLPPEGTASLNACHRRTQYRLSKPGEQTENKQYLPRHCCSPPGQLIL